MTPYALFADAILDVEQRFQVGAREGLEGVLAGDDGLVMAGRAPFQAPEVDGLIYFDGEQPRAGDIVDTTLIKAGPYDLIGRVKEG